MRKKAFTFIEVLVSVGILSFIAGATFIVLNTGDRTWHSELGLVDAQQKARAAMYRMVREVRQSDNIINISGGGSTLEFSVPGWASNVTYSLNGTVLEREFPVGTSRVIISNISSLVFTQTGGTLQIDIGATSTVRGRNLTYNLTDQVRLRND